MHMTSTVQDDLVDEPGTAQDGPDIVRRKVLTKFFGAIFAGLLAQPAARAGISILDEETAEPQPDSILQLPEERPDEDVILRMMRDLKRALEKPREERHWIMVIDQRKCVGCNACTVACMAENNLPPGVVYRPVLETEIGTYPNVTRRFTPRPCMQCGHPPCIQVCPVMATWKRSDGVVVIDYEKCIGCRYCISACPYGARSFDFGEFWTDGTPVVSAKEKAPSFEYTRQWKRDGGNVSPIGNARKCHFCIHRVEIGLLPQCTVTCIGRATFFGDGNDPESMVSELSSLPNMTRMKEHLGTEPNVFYLK
jgi:Fe-S-cluster-containing dehydrogenase component